MSDKDIFDEFEKSIDDAFKPDEKERLKNRKGYMFNDAYDKLLRQKWEAESQRRYVRSEKLKCAKCSNILELNILIKEPMRYHSILDRPYEENVSKYFCPICGSYFITRGVLIKINVEVK